MNNPKAYIVELARSFPCLRHLVSEDPEQWDVDSFMASRGVSSGEWIIMQFVAQVWNPSYAKRKGWAFDLVGGFGRIDTKSQSVIVAWASNPRWP